MLNGLTVLKLMYSSIYCTFGEDNANGLTVLKLMYSSIYCTFGEDIMQTFPIPCVNKSTVDSIATVLIFLHLS